MQAAIKDEIKSVTTNIFTYMYVRMCALEIKCENRNGKGKCCRMVWVASRRR